MSNVKLMGIINITPDSFSDGGQFLSVDAALQHAETLVFDGADILDIGAESSRPGAVAVSVQEEIDRLTPFLSQYSAHFDVPLSLDTYHSETASLGIGYGVRWINDITGLSYDKQMIPTIKKGKNMGIIIMHMKGVPNTMQDAPEYEDVVQEVSVALQEKIAECRSNGLTDIIIDPGIGFGKSVTHNLSLLRQLNALTQGDCPVLVGTSRKSFIGHITGASVQDRLGGSIASSLYAVNQGAGIIRCHDIKEMKQALQVWQAIEGRTSSVCS
jgi:dihydropteroate synthase